MQHPWLLTDIGITNDTIKRKRSAARRVIWDFTGYAIVSDKINSASYTSPPKKTLSITWPKVCRRKSRVRYYEQSHSMPDRATLATTLLINRVNHPFKSEAIQARVRRSQFSCHWTEINQWKITVHRFHDLHAKYRLFVEVLWITLGYSVILEFSWGKLACEVIQCNHEPASRGG